MPLKSTPPTSRNLLLAVVFLLTGLVHPAIADYHLATWNMKHLGWNDSERDWGRTAQVMSPFDFVAIQELHTERAIERLDRALETVTGEKWDFLISGRAIGSKRYKEYYAYIWRASRFKYTGHATIFLDNDRWFFREPFSARFLSSDRQHDFIAANIHVIYGDSVEQREDEADKLDEYVDWLNETFVKGEGAQGILLFGDFNLPPQSNAFNELRKRMRPAMVTGASTLSKADWKFANLYDQIWYKGIQPEFAGIFAFPSTLKVRHGYARDKISDHAPLFIRLPERKK